ncbi:MAG: hypothetical protein B7733_16865 [Myxococcales bacterium FL481]|nr:MAG: hypothetical protein B7733_16865 [Myxococcales bacterium FL481]
MNATPIEGLWRALLPVLLAVGAAAVAGAAMSWLAERVGVRDGVWPGLARGAVVVVALWLGWTALVEAWVAWTHEMWSSDGRALWSQYDRGR